MDASDFSQRLHKVAGWARHELPPAARSGMRQALVAAERRPAGRSGRVARVIAAVGGVLLGVAAVSGIFAAATHGPQPRLLLLAGGMLVPLALATRFPLFGWRIAWLATVLVPLLPGQVHLDPSQVVVLLVLLGVAAARYGRPTSWSLWAVTLVALWVWVGRDWRASLLATVVATLLCVAIDALSGWRRTRVALVDQTRRTQSESERRAVLEERARIAREMHDIVAHHLSLMAVQTQTAPYRLADLSEQVRTEFAVLNDSARAALADIRALLGPLRDGAPPPLSPQPSLADVPALVATARRAGMPVELRMTADTQQLRAAIATSAYRIVQEALSNVARHAPGAAASVAIDLQPDRLDIQVRNNRTGALPVPPEPRCNENGGHGLTGMRERVALHTGTLTVGPTSDGGFAVTAVLPVATDKRALEL